MPHPPERPTDALCRVCHRPFPVPSQSGPPPLTCSELCTRARKAQTARDRRHREGLIEDGKRWRALQAIVHDTASGLLPLSDSK